MNKPLTRRNALKLTVGAVAMPLTALAQRRSRPARSLSANARVTLEKRAAEFRQRILDVAKGPGGMIIAFADFATRRPLQEGAPLHGYLVRNLERVWGTASPRPTTAEWYYGENTLWATGWLL